MTFPGEQSREYPKTRVFTVFCVCSAVVAAVTVSAPATAQAPTFDVQAHRGGNSGAAEGSLRAFATSLEIGVSTLELDIGITRDAQPLVWHDTTIDARRCADTGPAFAADPQYPYVGKLVRDLTLAQLDTLDCGEPIATLPEVFALADSYRADVRYNIETKVDAAQPDVSADPQEFIDVVLTAVRAADKTDSVAIQSFDWRVLPMVRRVEPSIPVIALWDRHSRSAADPDPLDAALAAGATAVSPEYSMVDRELVERAHTMGLMVITWTVNDAAAMRQQIALGVDGIITDYPAMLRAVLFELGMPLPPAYHREDHGSSRCQTLGMCRVTPSARANSPSVRIETSKSSVAYGSARNGLDSGRKKSSQWISTTVFAPTARTVSDQ